MLFRGIELKCPWYRSGLGLTGLNMALAKSSA